MKKAAKFLVLLLTLSLITAAFSLFAAAQSAPFISKLATLPSERLAALVASLNPAGNHLSYSWVLAVLMAQPGLAEHVTALLERMAAVTTAVIDLVLPIPTWAFTKPAPQPLHGWSRAEYFPRMLPTLSQYLTEAQITRLRAAFGA